MLRRGHNSLGRSAARAARRGLVMERLEPRLVLTGSVVISELMALNTAGLADEDGDYSDWIEIYNSDAGDIDLGGWHLTDDADDPTKWTFPEGVTLQGGGLLVVYASGKDRTEADRQLHTNFGLNRSGEYLALVNRAVVDGAAIVEHEYDSFPRQFANVSYGLRTSRPINPDALFFFETPTPEMPNLEAGVDGFVEDTTFSTDRGFFETSEAFDLFISSDTPGATVYYTTDGTLPEPSSPTATVFDSQSPLRVERTSTVRAAAYKEGFVESNVDTQTYIFLDDVIRQSPGGEAPPLWPTGRVNSQLFNYGMDPDIVNDPVWGPQLKAALQSVSTISMVTDLENLIDPETGFYVNARGQGREWERPASIELIHPDGSEGFQIDAGVRPRGNFSASGNNPKHAFRFFFREEYGDKSLEYPLFGDEGVDSFRKLDLRTVQNDSWAYQASEWMTFIHDVYARDLQRDMGQPYTRSRYHHLYINGQYWGLFQSQERSEQHYGESYLGGDDDDYDIIKATGGPQYQTEATAGNFDAWRDLWTQARNIADDPSHENYMRIQGLHPDGTRNPEYPVLLDVDNLIDFMLGIFYTGDEDRGLSLPFGNNRPNNYFSARDREGERGFVFFAQDAEQSFESNHNVFGLQADRVGPFPDANQDIFEFSNPQWIHEDLAANESYRLRFADRVHKTMFNEGLLTPDHVIAGFETRADEIRLAIIAESARWGDAVSRRASNPFTQQDWLDNLQELYDDFIPFRGDIVMGQLRGAGLYPNVTAPSFNQHGGDVEAGFELLMSVTGVPAGTPIYFTTDGVTDPRGADGTIAGTLYTDSIKIDDSTLVQARTLIGGQWSALNAAQFSVAGADASNLRVSEIMFNPAAPTAAEIDQLAPQAVNNDDFEYVELLNISDQAISLVDVVFSDGVRFNFNGSDVSSLAAGGRVLVVRDQAAFAVRYPTVSGALIAGEFIDTRLSNGGEKLTVQDRFGLTIDSVDYKDGWYGLADGRGFSLSRREGISDEADSNVLETWRPSSESGGTPGEVDSQLVPLPGAVVINEVLAHSDGPHGDRIELLNTTDQPIILDGWFLSDDRSDAMKFRIGEGTTIEGGGFVVFDGLGASGFSTPDAPGVITPFDISALGGRVLLSAAMPDATLLGYREDVDFGASSDGVSFGRYVKSTGGKDIVAMSGNSFGRENPLPVVGPVVIHEIMYNPASGDRVDEFVELRNIGDAPLSLAGWQLGGGIDFEFSDAATIPAGGLLVVVSISPAEFRAAHDMPADAIVVGPYDGALSNAGESITLSRPGEPQAGDTAAMILVDRVKFNDASPWPVDADGQGPALQRLESDQYGNDPINWEASVSGGTPGDSIVAPRVSQVLLRGSDWSAEMLDRLTLDGLAGLSGGGVSMRGGEDQLRPVPWKNIDQVIIRFSEAVTVSRGDLAIVGLNTSDYETSGFDYDATTFTATWSLASPLSADKILLELSDAIHDVSGLSLDGNWNTGDVFPSGNGQLDDDEVFRFRLNVLPGDGDRDGEVTRRDLTETIFHLGISSQLSLYDPYLDVDGSGTIDLGDLRQTLFRFSTQLPSGEPRGSGGSSAVAATDDVFHRAGGGSPQAKPAANITGTVVVASDTRDADANSSMATERRRQSRSPATQRHPSRQGVSQPTFETRRGLRRRLQATAVDQVMAEPAIESGDILPRRFRRDDRR